MSVDNITASILSEAEKIAQASLKEAESTREEIINSAIKEAETIKRNAEEKALKDAESLKSRKVSAAELQSRKMVLGAKQDAIKKSYKAAINKLKSMPEDEYINFMLNAIIKVPYSGAIILNKKDREKIGEKLVEALNEKTKSNKFSLSDETVDASGGFVLRSGAIEINNTFETILDAIKDELTNDIANALFK